MEDMLNFIGDVGIGGLAIGCSVAFIVIATYYIIF